MNTENDKDRSKKKKSAESTDAISKKVSGGSDIMYETERRNAAKLIGLEGRQYVFAFVLLVVGMIAGLFVFGASYQIAAALGGIGALGLILGALSVPRESKSDPEKKQE